MRYLNRLVLGANLVVFISLPFLETLWGFETEEPMPT